MAIWQDLVDTCGVASHTRFNPAKVIPSLWDTTGLSMCPDEVLLETNLPLPLAARGKVRDLYDLNDSLLFVATDRISAFDCILGTGIPCKGRILTQMSLFWFDFLKDLTPNHLLTADVAGYPDILSDYREILKGRSMLVKKAEMIQVECVARGYLAGSGWKEYKAEGKVCGIPLPPGLRDGDKLPAPIFTPATKAQTGHDINVSLEQVAAEIGIDLADRLRDLTIGIYSRAAEYALQRGIILADTKFEFGFLDGNLVLADEVLTPDSSRYWPADSYKPGGPQLSFDKQYVRDYLETLAWNKRPPAPGLPAEVAHKTSEKYQEAYTRITGLNLFEDV
jgi:phosphoribosylaminoimidazole-succinocarboxamide synthase